MEPSSEASSALASLKTAALAVSFPVASFITFWTCRSWPEDGLFLPSAALDFPRPPLVRVEVSSVMPCSLAGLFGCSLSFRFLQSLVEWLVRPQLPHGSPSIPLHSSVEWLVRPQMSHRTNDLKPYMSSVLLLAVGFVDANLSRRVMQSVQSVG